MNKKHITLAVAAIALLIVGAAYGTKIPLIGMAAKKLPGSNAV